MLSPKRPISALFAALLALSLTSLSACSNEEFALVYDDSRCHHDRDGREVCEDGWGDEDREDREDGWSDEEVAQAEAECAAEAWDAYDDCLDDSEDDEACGDEASELYDDCVDEATGEREGSESGGDEDDCP